MHVLEFIPGSDHTTVKKTDKNICPHEAPYNNRGGSAWLLNVTALEVPVTSYLESGHWEVAAHHVSGPLCIS